MNTITIAITNYNRTDLLRNCLESIYDSMTMVPNSITEVVIVDDASNESTVKFVQGLKKYLPAKNLFPGFSLKVYFNETNLGMSLNKKRAIELSSNDWVIIFDSDNIMTPEYLSSIPTTLDDNTIYCPEKAQPSFMFTNLPRRLNKSNIAKTLRDHRNTGVLLNTCNYLVPKNNYLDTYVYSEKSRCADTITFNYRWLMKGNSLEILKGMNYFHLVHPGSGFMQDLDNSMKHALYMENLIKNNIWQELQ